VDDLLASLFPFAVLVPQRRVDKRADVWAFGVVLFGDRVMI